MTETAILLVDDHPVVREGYRRLLERQPGYRVVAEADSAASAYRAYRSTSPDAVIMDLSLPGAGGLDAIHHIKQWDKRARILVFTMHSGAAFALKAFEAGASGYITKAVMLPNLSALWQRLLGEGGRSAMTLRARSPPNGWPKDARLSTISRRERWKFCGLWQLAEPPGKSQNF